LDKEKAMSKFFVDPDIRKAETLPTDFYTDTAVFEQLKSAVFEKTWQWIGDDQTLVPLSESVSPVTLLDPMLSEPLLVVRDKEGNVQCLSNVCTHRGNILAHHPCKAKQLVCGYHGRRFGLDGAFKSMPEFEQAKDFPRPCDDLHRYDLRQWTKHLFVSIAPAFDFEGVLAVINERVGFLPLDQFKYDAVQSRDYIVNSHWALYCDNYLEGFHIPFVHDELNAAIDYDTYTTILYDHASLQIGYAKGASDAFDLPEGHVDYGSEVSAYYYWVFPNMMFNFYPWGLSINIVRPLSPTQSKVSFVTYVFDASKREKGAGAALDKVEREDEFVVEAVQKGIRSRHYTTGRFSPTREKGVHHFHRLLAEFMAE
jgi:choline monooxygenase|tara:strand:- start:334 stop:1440 length:1107 start_codon:yes stop_codon:yes gene_type:complete